MSPFYITIDNINSIKTIKYSDKELSKLAKSTFNHHPYQNIYLAYAQVNKDIKSSYRYIITHSAN